MESEAHLTRLTRLDDVEHGPEAILLAALHDLHGR